MVRVDVEQDFGEALAMRDSGKVAAERAYETSSASASVNRSTTATASGRAPAAPPAPHAVDGGAHTTTMCDYDDDH